VALGDLAQARLAGQHTLGTLSDEEAARLLDTLLGDAAARAEDAVRARVVQRAGGVPFFLVSCAEGLRLGTDEGSPRATAGAGDVPWDVVQSIRQRLVALPAVAQEVLGVAAVSGRETARALLAQVVARPERAIVTDLQGACDARLIEESGPTAYRFVHDVIREVVEGDLGAGQRMLLHQDIARVLEGMPGEAQVEALAYHYAHTEDQARAAYWLERAGDRALAGFATSAALAHYELARHHARLDPHEAAAPSRLDEKAGDCHVLLGQYDRAQEAFARARIALAPPARRAELWRKEAEIWARRGENARALAALDAAEAEGGPEGTSVAAAVRATLALGRADVHLRQHDYDATQRAAETALALLGAEEPGRAADQVAARAHFTQALVLWHRGESRTTEEQLRQSLALAERSGDPIAIGAAWTWLGLCAWSRGALEDAEAWHQRHLALAEQMGDQHGITQAWNHLGLVAMSRGALAQAEALLQRSLALADHVGNPDHSAEVWNGLGFVAWCRGDLARAEEYIRRGLALFDHLGDQFGSVSCSLGLGDVLGDRGDVAAAAAWCRAARRRLQRIGDHRLRATALVGQARACLRRGRLRSTAVLLKHAQALSPEQSMSDAFVGAALVAAEMYLRTRPSDHATLAQARAAADEALRLARGHGRRREEALARRLQGQCALAAGHAEAAEAQLRAALALQDTMGAALEAARTRLALAEVLGAGTGPLPAEPRALLAGAHAQFVRSGAALDLAEAERLTAVWESRCSG
jgi:tetratricopeptide (TPR) repeat protein